MKKKIFNFNYNRCVKTSCVEQALEQKNNSGIFVTQ